MLNKGFLKYGDEEKEKYFYVQINFGREKFPRRVTKFFLEKARKASVYEKFIYFLLKNSIKQKQKSDSNKYETVYESIFSFGTYAKTCMKY